MPKQEKKDKRSRSFTLTIFRNDRPHRQDWMSYLCTQQETCPSTQRLHWQTYVYVREAMTKSAFKKALPKDWNSPHFEVAGGSPASNILYCSKPESAVAGTFIEEGVRPQQGKRSDLALACREVISGGLRNVKDDTMIVKYGRGLSLLQSVRAASQPKPYEKKTVTWLWGDTGTGKTRYPYDNEEDLYRQTSAEGWFDGYYGQSAILIDDIEAGQFAVRDFLHILDGYRYEAKVKGGFTPLTAQRIYITSHDEPSSYFPSDRWEEINRRITIKIHKKKEFLLN